MAGSIANSVKATGNAVTSVTTAGVTTTTGSTFVIGVTHASGTAPNTPTDNKGNTYTIRGTTQTTGGGTGSTLFVCENGVGGTSHTITQTFAAAADPSVFFVEVTGVLAASFDTGARAQVADSASPFTVTSGTLAQADEIVLALIGHGSAANPATLAESTGFTIAIAEENASLFWSGGIAYKVVSATTALTPSFTATGAGDAALHIAGFQASTGGPTITSQPQSQRIPAGQAASFSVGATGSGSLTYQWQSNVGGTFANISGETASSYTTGTLTAGTAYAVRCVVTDSNGSTNTSTADVWTPVSKPAPWAGYYARATTRDDVGAWLSVPTSKSAGPVVDSALWGVSTAAGSHSTSGALTAGSATIAGTAAHSTLHATSGALASAAATVAGSAAHLTLHTTTGALTAGSATVAGAANHAVGHATTGALSAGSATISGAAVHPHTTSGALVAGSATIAGAADHAVAGATHGTSGALAADAATVAGSATHLTLHTTSGALASGSATVAGVAAHPHATTGALQAGSATVAGAAAHAAPGVHAASGALVAGDAQISGTATLDSLTPPASGGGGGPAAAPGGMLHRYKLLQAFKDKKERDEAVKKLPAVTERERVILRKSARALIKSEPVNYKELETRVSKDLESIGYAPAPNHLDWLLYFLRVEAHAIAQAQLAAQQDEEMVQILMMALLE